jgi:hypothetical protein
MATGAGGLVCRADRIEKRLVLDACRGKVHLENGGILIQPVRPEVLDHIGHAPVQIHPRRS